MFSSSPLGWFWFIFFYRTVVRNNWTSGIANQREHYRYDTRRKGERGRHPKRNSTNHRVSCRLRGCRLPWCWCCDVVYSQMVENSQLEKGLRQ
uniref:Putative secreted protein n=1 Tax=Anopheles darlingi TaxID=43151 RepID=A0A2M4DE08_ANODA